MININTVAHYMIHDNFQSIVRSTEDVSEQIISSRHAKVQAEE